jgi:predicted XRE-type DNA-binding protein
MPSLAQRTPAQTLRAVRALRLALIDAIIARLARHPVKQVELAALLGITPPRLNRLLKRDVDLFGLDSLAAIATRAGFNVRVSVSRWYDKG